MAEEKKETKWVDIGWLNNSKTGKSAIINIDGQNLGIITLEGLKKFVNGEYKGVKISAPEDGMTKKD